MRAPSRPVQAVLVLILWMAVMVFAGGPPPEDSTIPGVVTGGIVRQFIAASAFLVLAALALRWRGLGLSRPRPGTLRLLWLPGLYLLLFASLVVATGLPSPAVAAILLVNILLVGFSEELAFRGFLYSGLRDRLRIWPAAAITSALFGAIHVMNVFLTGHIQAALLQSLAAALIGLLLLGLRLRSGSIWTAIGVHAAWNYGPVLIALGEPPLPPDAVIPLAAQVGSILFVLPVGLYGLWLIRSAARDGDGLGPIVAHARGGLRSRAPRRI